MQSSHVFLVNLPQSGKMKHSSDQYSHARYGPGTVKAESENSITVEFENYGVKEFIRAFTKLEEME